MSIPVKKLSMTNHRNDFQTVPHIKCQHLGVGEQWGELECEAPSPPDVWKSLANKILTFQPDWHSECGSIKEFLSISSVDPLV